MIIFTLNLYAKERDLLDSPLKSLLGVAYALTFIKGLRKNITP